MPCPFPEILPLSIVKQILSLFLACCILGQASVRTLWVLHYQWNRAAYIAQCENKNKPGLHCDGKCYLKKKMGVKTNENAGEPRLPESFHQIKDLHLFFEETAGLPKMAAALPTINSFPVCRTFYPDAPPKRLLKPPAT